MAQYILNYLIILGSPIMIFHGNRYLPLVDLRLDKGVAENNRCNTCNTVANMDHILFDCEKHYQACSYDSIPALNVETPCNLQQILTLNRKDILDLLILSLKQSGENI
ncbi:hypothetical protein Trydic_g10718 [Trypoxylus dichotomus]